MYISVLMTTHNFEWNVVFYISVRMTIFWRDIDSTTKDMFALSQHNAHFNAETKRMKRILHDKYSKADIITIAESSTHIDFQERNELYTLLNKYKCLFDGDLGTWHSL